MEEGCSGRSKVSVPHKQLGSILKFLHVQGCDHPSELRLDGVRRFRRV